MAADFDLEMRLGGRVAGLDEAGRGPWAGPVCAAAVVFEAPDRIPAGLDDSKKLTIKARTRLAAAVKASGADWAVGWASAAEVDRHNPLGASFLAMARALARLVRPADNLLVDGSITPNLDLPAQAIVGGDGRSASIAAASILAKTARDAYMARLDAFFPAYAWASNKGYGAPAHRAAMASHGVTRHHRTSFKPVAAIRERLSS